MTGDLGPPGRDVGPPEKERPSGYQAARPDQQLDSNTNKDHSTASGRTPGMAAARPS